MSLTVSVADNGLSATVASGKHTTQIVGIDDGLRWVRFYQRMAGGKHGHLYQPSVTAFQQAVAEMRQRQSGASK